MLTLRRIVRLLAAVWICSLAVLFALVDAAPNGDRRNSQLIHSNYDFSSQIFLTGLNVGNRAAGDQHQPQKKFYEVDALGDDYVDFGALTGPKGAFSWHATYRLEKE